MPNSYATVSSLINIPDSANETMTSGMNELYKNMLSYRYPKMVIQIDTREIWECLDYGRLEQWMRLHLMSADPEVVKAGLANIVFWGNYQSGYVYHRMNQFLNTVTKAQIAAFMDVAQSGIFTLISIKDCQLPQFSNVSFVSKVLMFLEPTRFVTLDLQLAKLIELPGPHILSDLTVYDTALPITRHNIEVYSRWCEHCRNWASRYPRFLGVRAADVERGIFGVIQVGQAECARPFL